MSEKYFLIAFLAVLATMLAIVICGLIAVRLGLQNKEAYGMLAGAVAGLSVLASQFKPGRPGKGDPE